MFRISKPAIPAGMCAVVIAGASDVTIVQIIGTGAIAEELAKAQAWLCNDEVMMNSDRTATARGRGLVEILGELEPDEDDVRAAGPSITQE